MPPAPNSLPQDSGLESPTLGWLDRREFEVARRSALCFSGWRNYREFIAERDALFLGYGTAGVSVKRQRVSFRAFQRWSRLTGAPLDIDGLDVFAAHCRWRSSNPEAPVIGRFGASDDPERIRPAEAGVQCLRIRPEVFVRWRDEFAQTGVLDAPELDVYAAYVAELCLPPEGVWRRPTVSSS